MSKGLNPIDVPPSGRYDFTITKVGKNRDKLWTIHATIDNGRYVKKRVSSVLQDGEPPRKFERVNAKLDVTTMAKIGGEWREVPLTHKEHNVVVGYSLSDFQRPAAPPKLNFKEQRRKFRRR